MSTQLFTDRYYTAGNDRDVVLFRIGMRVNGIRGLRGLRETLGMMARMPRMLAELESTRALGMLSSSTAVSWGNIEITQFWRSYEDLDRYASARDRNHAPAWAWWNAIANKTGAVGIWHETYRIAAGTYESIYGFMPRRGLALATDHRPVGPGEARSRERIKPAELRKGGCPVAHAR